MMKLFYLSKILFLSLIFFVVKCEEVEHIFDCNKPFSSFYYEYLAKYYPKAHVICQKFVDMTADQIAYALNDILCIFSKKPWFYFQNTPKGFKLIHYWEYILDQCGIIHNFLKLAEVDLESGKITFQKDFSWERFSFSFLGGNEILNFKQRDFFDYLKSKHPGVYAAFYMFSFDYMIKFFNEGILLKDSRLASRYFGEIEFVLGQLRGTPKESDYYEAAKTCRDLLGILKKRQGVDVLSEMQKSASSGISRSNDPVFKFSEELSELTNVL